MIELLGFTSLCSINLHFGGGKSFLINKNYCMLYKAENYPS